MHPEEIRSRTVRRLITLFSAFNGTPGYFSTLKYQYAQLLQAECGVVGDGHLREHINYYNHLSELHGFGIHHDDATRGSCRIFKKHAVCDDLAPFDNKLWLASSKQEQENKEKEEKARQEKERKEKEEKEKQEKTRHEKQLEQLRKIFEIVENLARDSVKANRVVISVPTVKFVEKHAPPSEISLVEMENSSPIKTEPSSPSEEMFTIQMAVEQEDNMAVEQEQQMEDIVPAAPSRKRKLISKADKQRKARRTDNDLRLSRPEWRALVIQSDGNFQTTTQTFKKRWLTKLASLSMEDGTYMQLWVTNRENEQYNRFATALANIPSYGENENDRKKSARVRYWLKGLGCTNCGSIKHIDCGQSLTKQMADRIMYGDMVCRKVDEDGDVLPFTESEISWVLGKI